MSAKSRSTKKNPNALGDRNESDWMLAKTCKGKTASAFVCHSIVCGLKLLEELWIVQLLVS